jgi:hypothetical protein
MNSNSKIKNQIINLNVNLTNVNSSISKQQLSINATVNNILSRVMSIENTINIIENNIMSNINQTSLNITTKILTVKSLLLTAMNSSIQFKLTPGMAYLNGSYIDIPIYATTLNDAPLNLSMTKSIAKNISANYISPSQKFVLDFKIIKIQPGTFIVELKMNDSEKQAIVSGNATISLSAPIKVGAFSNIAAGIIGSTTFKNVNQNIFGLTLPPNANVSSVQGIISLIAYIGSTQIGRAIYTIVISLALIYYVWKINEFQRRKRKK